MFTSHEVDQVEILFSRFVNTLSQRPESKVVLPLNREQGLQSGFGEDAASSERVDTRHVQYLFEPSPAAVMELLLSVFLDFQIAQFLLEAKASEQSARMVAMKNATDNAQQLIKDLTLEYNKLRQANITKELLEISSAAMALG
jgi:F-type H+-transporting ATPase subunit gamma